MALPKWVFQLSFGSCLKRKICLVHFLSDCISHLFHIVKRYFSGGVYSLHLVSHPLVLCQFSWLCVAHLSMGPMPSSPLLCPVTWWEPHYSYLHTPLPYLYSLSRSPSLSFSLSLSFPLPLPPPSLPLSLSLSPSLPPSLSPSLYLLPILFVVLLS